MNPAVRRPAHPDPDDAASVYPWLVTLPLWHFPGGPTDFLHYPGHVGAIALAGRACESFPTGLPEHYWAFTEDDLHTNPEREFSSLSAGGENHCFNPLDGTAGPWGCGDSQQVVTSPVPLQLFGIGPPGTRIQSLSMEGWFSERRNADWPPTDTDAASRIDICGPPEENGDEPGPSSQRIRVFVRPRADGSASTVNVEMHLTINANTAFHGNIFSGPGTEIPYRDTAGHGRSGQDHVVFVIEREAGRPDRGPRHYRLYVNGTRVAEQYDVAGLAPSAQHLFAAHADEIRIYDYALTDARVAQRHALGRFILPGPAGGRPTATFRSPRYLFDAPARLLRSGWTLVPCADPRVCVRVTVRGYDAAGNTLGAAVLEDAGEAGSLAGIPPSARSFDYEVEFANRTADTSPLYHTPLFESIWFTFRRKGRAPAWEEMGPADDR